MSATAVKLLSRKLQGVLEDRGGWRADAACREHPEVDFFPQDSYGVALAQRVCADCPVRLDCLEWALARPELHGVWGGRSERERVKIKRDGGLWALRLGKIL